MQMIELPESIEINTLSSVIKKLESELKNLKKNEPVCLNFSDCKYISPTGAVYIDSFRDHLKNCNHHVFARIQKESKLYRFFKVFGLIENKDNDNDEYLSALEKFAVKIKKCRSISESISVQKSIMKKIISRTQCTETTQAALNYIISEIADNAGVHGYKCYDKIEYPKPIYKCSFSYSNRVEVAILDIGQGIYNSLKTNKYTELKKKNSIIFATQNKITGHPNGSPGFGLFSAVEMVKGNLGNFNIWSSNRHYSLKGGVNEESKAYLNRGTIVSFVVNADVETPFQDIYNANTLDKRNAEEYLELEKEVFGE